MMPNTSKQTNQSKSESLKERLRHIRATYDLFIKDVHAKIM